MSTFILLFLLSAACFSFTDSAPPNAPTGSINLVLDKITSFSSLVSRGFSLVAAKLEDIKTALKEENTQRLKVIFKINALELRENARRQKLLQTINRTSDRLEKLSRNVSNILTLLSDYNLDWSCTAGWVKRGRRCYRFSGCTSAGCTFTTANATCIKEGAILASVRSEKENKFISSLASKSTNFILLGGTDAQVEGQWKWGDGSPLTYTNWNNSQPDNSYSNEDCLHIKHHVHDTWNDINCAYSFSSKDGYICEKAAK